MSDVGQYFDILHFAGHAEKERAKKLCLQNPGISESSGDFCVWAVFLLYLLSLFALKVVPLSMSPILESSGYIFVSILSYMFLKEKLTGRQILGIALIIAGIAIYTLKI